MLRIGRDRLQHRVQCRLILHAAAMQADVDLEVGAKLRAKALRQFQVLRQPFRRIDQPLQLARRIEAALQRGIEARRRAYRHRLAEQDVGIRECLGFGIQERLVEGHQATRAGLAEHVVEQADAGQRLGDHAETFRRADRLGHDADVVIDAIEVDQHAGPHRSLALQLGVECAEVLVVRRTLLARPRPPGPCDAEAGDSQQYVATFHFHSPLAVAAQTPNTVRRCGFSSLPCGSSSLRIFRKSSQRGYSFAKSAAPSVCSLPQ